MPMDSKTPLHSVVSVICDALSDLGPLDQARALDLAHISLGLPTPRPAESAATRRQRVSRVYDVQDLDLDPIPSPLMQVQMMGGQPLGMNQLPNRSGRALVVIGPQQQRYALQLSTTAQARAQAARGYVRTLRSSR